MIRVHFPDLVPGQVPMAYAASLRVNGLAGAILQPGPEYSKFDQLNAEAPNFFEVADIDNAELIVYPYRATTGAQTERIAQEAQKRKIGCVFFSWGDFDEPVNVSYGTVYRHSMFADTRLPHERAATADVCDPQVELGLPLWPREWQPTPRVGFCGFVSSPFKRTLYRLTGRSEKTAGLVLRARALRALRRTTGIERNFVGRQYFWGGMWRRFQRTHDPEFRPRAEFWDNILNSDYTLCARGCGNFSYRFYEVLAAGRIPLFINTRCVLPFEDQIEWKQHCVWVEEKDLDSIGDIVRDFHSRLTPDGFRILQMANRRLWETRLSPLAFFKKAMADELERHIPKKTWDDSQPTSVEAS